MRKATITYHAPPGDAKFVQMAPGVRLIDGEQTVIRSDENPHLFGKFKAIGNGPPSDMFDVEIGEEEKAPDKPKSKGGRPSNAELAERERAKAAADKDNGKDPTPEKGQGDPNPIGYTGGSPQPKTIE